MKKLRSSAPLGNDRGIQQGESLHQFIAVDQFDPRFLGEAAAVVGERTSGQEYPARCAVVAHRSSSAVEATVVVPCPGAPTRDPFAYAAVEQPAEPADPQHRTAPSDEPPPDFEAAAREAASRLQLAATIAGAQRRAVINGSLLEVGDRIDGFTVKQIEPRRVVLECRGMIIHLEM